MILSVGPVHTTVEGSPRAIEMLQSSMTLEGEDEDGSLVDLPLMVDNKFYSGMMQRVTRRLNQLSISHSVKYTYKLPKAPTLDFEFPSNILPGITLRPYQCMAAKKFLLHSGRGLLEAGTGAGKTEIAIALTKFLNVRTIFFCDRVFTMEQTYERFRSYGIKVGRLGGGHRELEFGVLVAVVDSLYVGVRAVRDRRVADYLRTAQFLIVDEAHHGSSRTWMTVLENSDAPYRLGMSASSFGTPTEVDYDDLLLVGVTGDIISKITPRWLIDHGTCKHCNYSGHPRAYRCPSCGQPMRGYLAEPFIYIHPVRAERVKSWDYNTVYQRGIVDPKVRNDAIVSIANQFDDMGLKTLVLVNRIKHGFKLIEMFNRDDTLFSFGGGKVYYKPDPRLRSRRKFHEDVWAPQRVRDYFDKRKAGILIGSSVFDEGVDLPSMRGLVLGGGGKSWRRTIQQIGRPMHSKEEFIFVADLRDLCHKFLLKHSDLRRAMYRRLGYSYFADPKEFSKRLPRPLVF